MPIAYAIVLAVAASAGDGALPTWVWIPHAIAIAATLALIVYCVLDINRRSDLSESARTSWILLIVLLSFIAVPAYLLTTARPRPSDG